MQFDFLKIFWKMLKSVSVSQVEEKERSITMNTHLLLYLLSHYFAGDHHTKSVYLFHCAKDHGKTFKKILKQNNY